MKREKKTYEIKERPIAMFGISLPCSLTWDKIEPSAIVEASTPLSAMREYARSKTHDKGRARIVKHGSGLTSILYSAYLLGKEIRTARAEIIAEEI